MQTKAMSFGCRVRDGTNRFSEQAGHPCRDHHDTPPGARHFTAAPCLGNRCVISEDLLAGLVEVELYSCSSRNPPRGGVRVLGRSPAGRPRPTSMTEAASRQRSTRIFRRRSRTRASGDPSMKHLGMWGLPGLDHVCGRAFPVLVVTSRRRSAAGCAGGLTGSFVQHELDTAHLVPADRWRTLPCAPGLSSIVEGGAG